MNMAHGGPKQISSASIPAAPVAGSAKWGKSARSSVQVLYITSAARGCAIIISAFYQHFDTVVHRIGPCMHVGRWVQGWVFASVHACVTPSSL
eukprot:CAMPEP_0174362776 /NCGR_PEP_ID=MMETSP0811_2-20130205/66068_1 /TAXON_ID=73025 ORGANISM="Eutreptiella gymnastica-like, Strain CCMP1594" /NCGR_SAMPLE_ID=MMETSP0811_2 /ASSEMBLY_ACC=CAM_ASM_000667 /LENGTH=92 /DNA_ID=CAMNT_0015500829 /DNA_START=186 /DNA_END=461 /DNA_ORIENTATION=-